MDRKYNKIRFWTLYDVSDADSEDVHPTVTIVCVYCGLIYDYVLCNAEQTNVICNSCACSICI